MSLHELLAPLAPYVTALAIAVIGGLCGTLLETVGKYAKSPLLVALGQRIEGALTDVPKLLRGSRMTRLENLGAVLSEPTLDLEREKARRQKDDEPPDPPSIPPLAPAAAFLVVLGLLFAPALPACSSGAKDASAVVERSSAFAYDGAEVALEVLDAQERAHIDTLNSSMTRELDAAAKRVDRLKRARDALAVVRAWLVHERTESDARAALKDAVTLLLLAAQEAEADGRKPPESFTQGLQAASAWLGVQ